MISPRARRPGTWKWWATSTYAAGSSRWSQRVTGADRSGSLDFEVVHHAVRDVRLPVFGVGHEADERVAARGEVGGEVGRVARCHRGDTAFERAWRRPLHALGPRGEVFPRLAAIEMDEHDFVRLGTGVGDADLVLAGGERRRGGEAVVGEGDGRVCVRRLGAGGGRRR